jgi:hypothetical protein
MLAGGKGGECVIEAFARSSSTYAAVPSSTICMLWLTLNRFKLIFRTLNNFLTDALAAASYTREEKQWATDQPSVKA